MNMKLKPNLLPGVFLFLTERMVNIRTGVFLFTIRCYTAQHHALPEKVADDLAIDTIKKLLEK